jgi:hypothetical protein
LAIDRGLWTAAGQPAITIALAILGASPGWARQSGEPTNQPSVDKPIVATRRYFMSDVLLRFERDSRNRRDANLHADFSHYVEIPSLDDPVSISSQLSLNAGV